MRCFVLDYFRIWFVCFSFVWVKPPGVYCIGNSKSAECVTEPTLFPSMTVVPDCSCHHETVQHAVISFLSPVLQEISHS
jgi:hypothetical protein